MIKFVNTKFIKLKALNEAPKLNKGVIVCFAREGEENILFYQVQGNGYASTYEFCHGSFSHFMGIEMKELSTMVESSLNGYTDFILCAIPKKMEKMVLDNVHNPCVGVNGQIATF